MITVRVMYQLKRLQQALKAAMDQELEPIGLTSPQYAALAVIDQAPGISGAELARTCFVTPQSMNELVQGLCVAGLVERRPHPENGRVIQHWVMGEGKVRLEKAHVLITAVETRMMVSFSSDEQRQFRQHLERCHESLDRS